MNEQRNLAVALRPSTLSECIGNTKIINQIRTLLDSGHVPTAFLLSGPTGIGKTTIARCISEHLKGELVETNAADETGVEAARHLGEEAQHRPMLGDYKVLVLDEAQQLTKQAQNALLKHVEDAASSTIWVFGTTEPTKIIPALKGRCVSFTLSGLTSDQVALLVYRGLNHLGKKGNAKTEEFIKTLIVENITSPRAILNAVEQFAGGMDVLGSIFGLQDTPQAFEIAKAAAKQDWARVSVLLSQATSEEAMTIRMVTASCFKSALLKNPQEFSATAILELTKDIPFDGPLGLANLCAILYKICKKGGTSNGF